MTRSELSKKFMQKRVNDFIKKYREDYKKENGKPFKGNVLKEITMGVFKTKGIPEPEDTILLGVLGNPNCEETEVIEFITNWVANNPDRGWLGAHCELSKDLLCIDIPLDPVTREQVINMENTIIEQQKAIVEMNKAMMELAKKSTTDNKSADVNK